MLAALAMALKYNGYQRSNQQQAARQVKRIKGCAHTGFTQRAVVRTTRAVSGTIQPTRGVRVESRIGEELT